MIIQFLISATIACFVSKYPDKVEFNVSLLGTLTFPRLLTSSLIHSLVNLVDEISTDRNQLVHLRDVSLEQS